MTYKALRVIISGGGTGGHIFPAISIADRLKSLNPNTQILFVGAEGKMEMEKVPRSGYEIKGLPVAGLQRKLSPSNIWENLKLPVKLVRSLRKAGSILRDFNPDIVVGVGGFASGPVLWKAESMGIPTLIQEQNGFAGLTNRLLGKKAGRICTAYEGMEKFFPGDKIVLTGNPIRREICAADDKGKRKAIEHFGFNPEKKHLLIVGGSLGSGTLNKAVRRWISEGRPGGEDVEILWQCGSYYKKGVDEFISEQGPQKTAGIIHTDFISEMNLAYAAADAVISRSGASSISELCVAQKACIFVPSPNVAEDHQTHNAMALVRKGAALIVKDEDAEIHLLPKAMHLLRDSSAIKIMERNISMLGIRNADLRIAEEIYELIEK